jgi:hypothetical protein
LLWNFLSIANCKLSPQSSCYETAKLSAANR